MPLWEWRSNRRLLFLLCLFLTTTTSVKAQSSEPKEVQQKVRNNRVWSMRLSFKTCGTKLVRARIAKIYSDSSLGKWHPMNPDFTVIQWSHVLPFEIETDKTFYGIHDLLVDYAQTRYMIQVMGTGTDGSTSFSKMFWVTPVGLSKDPIGVPPIRNDRDTAPWGPEDEELLAEWSLQHEWGNRYFSREFRALLHKLDKKIEIQVNLIGSGCEEAK